MFGAVIVADIDVSFRAVSVADIGVSAGPDPVGVMCLVLYLVLILVLLQDH